MWNQPTNKLSPFEVVDSDGNPIISIKDTGVQVKTLIFPDGSILTSSGISTISYSDDVDCGTF